MHMCEGVSPCILNTVGCAVRNHLRTHVVYTIITLWCGGEKAAVRLKITIEREEETGE